MNKNYLAAVSLYCSQFVRYLQSLFITDDCTKCIMFKPGHMERKDNRKKEMTTIKNTTIITVFNYIMELIK